MMSGHISIPEQDMMGLNYEESFRGFKFFSNTWFLICRKFINQSQSMIYNHIN